MVSTENEVTAAAPSPDPDDEPTVFDPANRVYQKVSVRGPALIVLGLAVFIVVAGVVASAVDSGGTPVLSIHSVTIPDGTVVRLVPATTALRTIVSAGQPPADILGNMAVPAGSTVSGTINSDQGSGQFDRTVTFHTGLTTDQVVQTYRTVLPKLGWQVIYNGPGSGKASSGTEVLGKHASGDGFYWEVGVVVSPTTSAGVTPYSVELFQLPDDEN